MEQKQQKPTNKKRKNGNGNVLIVDSIRFEKPSTRTLCYYCLNSMGVKKFKVCELLSKNLIIHHKKVDPCLNLQLKNLREKYAKGKAGT